MTEYYKREARRIDAMRKIAESQSERDYWHGYRQGLVDSLENVEPTGRERRERAYALNQPEMRDRQRAAKALGYWDGRRWEELGSVIDPSQSLLPAQWIERYGVLFGVTSEEYVRQMCRGQEVSKGDYTFTAKLPWPFTPEKSGDRWIIRALWE